MSTNEAAPTSSGAAQADPPALDTSRAHQARVYDYLLGSYLAISHAGSDLLDTAKHDSLMGVADRMIQNKITYRSREQVAAFFDGTDLAQPGLVRVEEWRPDAGTVSTERSTLWGGAGRKR